MSGGCDRERSDEERALDRLRAEVRRLTAEIDRLRAENDSDRGMHEAQLASVAAERDHLKDRERSIIEACERVADGGQYRADIVSAIQTIRKQRDDAKTEIARLKADLLLLGALKSEEVAPVIERFRAAFGADVSHALSGKRALTFERAIQIGEKVHGLYPSEAAAVLLAEFGEPAKVDPPVRHARHDRHCMIGDGVGCSREPGCEVER